MAAFASARAFPVVAVELEFYLIDRQRDAEGYLQPPCAPGTQERNTQSQVYSVDNLNHFADVLSEIDELARLQGIPADGAVAEASPGQFEVNLHHTDDVLQACDHALALKRLVRMVAETTTCRRPLWPSRMRSTPAAACTCTSAC